MLENEKLYRRTLGLEQRAEVDVCGFADTNGRVRPDSSPKWQKKMLGGTREIFARLRARDRHDLR